MMLRIWVAVFAVFVFAGLARADGFKLDNLNAVQADVSGYSGGGTFDYEATEPDRLTVHCTGCEGLVAVDVLLGQSTDGTEARYRSGETTIEKMAALCKANNPSCELEAVEQGPAVGWVTRYGLTRAAGSTAVLFLNGDQLIIRSIADDVETAAQNGAYALRTIGRQIIGED